MNLDNFNKWLTLTANVGVLAGIVFLAVEIQQSRQATVAATYQARQSEIQESDQNFALSDYLPPIYEKLNSEGLDSLSGVELIRLRAWERARAGRMRSQLDQYELGFLDDDIRFAVRNGVLQFFPLWEQLGISVNSKLIEVAREGSID
jgi:hypothetical protein